MTHAQNERFTDKKQNLARFFLEQRHIAWVSLAVAILWGVYGLLKMPQRKDPDIPVRQAMIIVPWQGTSSEQVEQLVTRKIEQAIALNQWVTEIKSASRTGSAMVQFELAEKGKYDRDKELDDVKIRLDAIHDLPQGAGPILYIKDFGDTSALMLTVASPPADPAQVAWISKLVETQIRQVRSGLDAHTQSRRSIVVVFPKSIDSDEVERKLSWVTRDMATQHLCSDVRVFSGAGFTGVDLATNLSTPDLQSALRKFANQDLQTDELHPDAWKPAIIDDPANTTAALQTVAGDKYTYRDLDDFTDTLQRSLKTLPIVAKAERSGVLDENVFLNFSQERLAQYKLRPADLPNILAARNLPESGQSINARGRTVSVNTTGEFKSIDDLRSVVIGTSPTGTPLYLRDLVDIDRGYENPPSFLNRYTRRDESGRWITTRAITLSVQMKKGEQIGSFGKQVDANLASVRKTLPADLVLARTSDQPLQVHDSIELFSHSLIEALVLVVVVALIGFWSWRTAILIAASMPITLAITFGVINTLGIDLQQVSIASLIIALGLLVDVPVVSGDAIVRELGAGQPRSIAAWLGPTKLFKTMAFATVTNIVSYLPFLMLPGEPTPFFVVMEGTTEVLKDVMGRRTEVSEHKQGDFFGELAILMATAAPASVRAKTACHLARLDPQHLQELIRRSPECSAVILQTLNERVQIVQKYMLNLPSSRVQIVGSKFNDDCREIRAFLTMNRIPYEWVDRDRSAQLPLADPACDVAGLSVIVDDSFCVGHPVTVRKVAEALGFQTAPHQQSYDVVIIGGGPAGLAAAVYGASEGLSVLLVERKAPGGQAGTSSRIENYLGFPNGISGDDLSQRAFRQAIKFGAEVVLTREVQEIIPQSDGAYIRVADWRSSTRRDRG